MGAAKQLSVNVPVNEPLDFLYPLKPTKRIQEGSKTISFRPPFEKLRGERIHQWVGARKGQGRWANDLGRICRQQTFLRALLNQGFDFASVIANATLAQLSSSDAIDELRQVDASWDMDCFNYVRPETIDGKMVLVKDADEWPARIQRPWQYELTVIVLARGAPRKAVKTIRSLLKQDTAVRILVVNAGGGKMGGILARAGLDVGVINRTGRLAEHEALALGLRSTRSPYVAFVPAGYIAYPGWAKSQLEAHHEGEAVVGNKPTRPSRAAPSEWKKWLIGWFSRWGWTAKHREWSAVSYRRDLVPTQSPFTRA